MEPKPASLLTEFTTAKGTKVVAYRQPFAPLEGRADLVLTNGDNVYKTTCPLFGGVSEVLDVIKHFENLIETNTK